MLSITHAAVGAFIAVKVSNPVLAVPLILLSHYLADAVPHWDAGTGLSKGGKSPSLAVKHEIVDLALAAILVLAMFPLSSPLDLSSPQIWGAFVALIPDLLEAPRNFLKYEPRVLRPLNKFHHSFHHSIPRMLDGLTPQILLLTCLWIFR